MSTASSGQGKSNRMRCASAKATASMNASLPKSSTENMLRKRRASMQQVGCDSDPGRGGAAGEAFAQPRPVQVELNAEHNQPAEQGRRIRGVMLAVEIEHGLMEGDLRLVALAAGGPFDVHHGN